MAEFYSFDPSADIQRGFQKAGAGISDIFAHLVATQKRDNEVADKTFQNIEALKKDVNIYGQKVITNKTNALLKDASKLILDGGKLDYSQLGAIRQRVSDISDEKKKYELGAELRKEYMQLGIANKDNITNFEGFIKSITAPLMDPNIKNATDLQAAMQDAYDKNLNLDRIGVKSVLSILPKEPIKAYGKNGKGDIVNYEIDAIKGSKYDINTGKVIGPDAAAVNDLVSTMKGQMPEYFDNYRKRLGVNEDILPDSAIANKLISQIATPRGESLVQTGTSQKLEEAKLRGQEIENLYAPRKIKAAIAHTEAETYRIYNPVDKGGGLSLNFGGGRTKENVNNFLKITEKGDKMESTIPKPFKMNLEGYNIFTTDPKNPKKKLQTPLGDFEVNAIEKVGKDKWIIKGFHAKEAKNNNGMPSANIDETLQTNRRRVNITLDKKGYNSFMNRLHGMGNAEQVESLNTIEMMSYLTPKQEAVKQNPYKQLKLSDVYSRAQQENVPVLYILGLASDQGFSIYNDQE
jgi:hypothetical protein